MLLLKSGPSIAGSTSLPLCLPRAADRDTLLMAKVSVDHHVATATGCPSDLTSQCSWHSSLCPPGLWDTGVSRYLPVSFLA